MEQTSLLSDDPWALEKEAYQRIKPALVQVLNDWYLPESALNDNIKKEYYSIRLYNSVVFRIRLRGKKPYIQVSASLTEQIPFGSNTWATKSDEGYIKIFIASPSEIFQYQELLCLAAEREIQLLPLEFDCCHLYTECSDAKCCIHPDKDFTKGCRYKRILRSGKIYYGKNRNIDELGNIK